MELRKHIPLLPMIILITSCSYVNPGLLVFWGNYQMEQGNFQKANVSFLDAMDWDSNKGLIEFNLGNSYYSLGERESAMIRWEQAHSEEQDFLFKLTFNKGVYYYEKGLYHEAAAAFKQAVILKPSDWDSKINLELALNRVNSSFERKPEEQKSDNDQNLFDDTERLLNYLRRQDETHWESAAEKSTSRENDW